MTRTAARELAILLGFAAGADGAETAQETMDRFFEPEHYASMAEENPLFAEYPDERQMEYIRSLVTLMAERRETLDAYIEKYARGWKADRISRTAGAVLRCAMSEILWLPEVPNAAAINEAVELAKKYEDADTVAFINGILGGFVRGEVEQEKETT
jgi:N utilization substance protein B